MYDLTPSYSFKICDRLEHNMVYVIFRPLSTVGYTSVTSVIHRLDSGLTNLIHDLYWTLSKREINTFLAGCVHLSVNKPRE